MAASAAAGLTQRQAIAAQPPAVLSIHGLVRREAGETAVHFTMAALEQLPVHRIKTTTPWHVGEREFAGPLLRAVLAAAGAQGTSLHMRALNDYHVDIPFDDPRQYDVVLANRIDGQTIGVRDKGPLFLMYPFDRQPGLRNSVYLGRCIWQLRHIECR